MGDEVRAPRGAVTREEIFARLKGEREALLAAPPSWERDLHLAIVDRDEALIGMTRGETAHDMSRMAGDTRWRWGARDHDLGSNAVLGGIFFAAFGAMTLIAAFSGTADPAALSTMKLLTAGGGALAAVMTPGAILAHHKWNQWKSVEDVMGSWHRKALSD